MITAPFWKGSGLGNQLFRYVMCRTLAMDKDLDFGMEYPENFKGYSFLNLDMGKGVYGGTMDKEGGIPITLPDGILSFYKEKKIMDNGIESIDYDWNLLDVRDNTKIDGEFQGERYFKHRKGEIRKWLKTEELKMDDNLCIINFRGGEFQYVPDLFLTADYWFEARNYIKSLNPKIKFEVHTDDVSLASRFFSQIPIIHDIGLNWRSIRYAKYLILSNSSFAIFPAWLNERAKVIVAPKFWGRRNKGFWHCRYNKYKCFTYL